MGNLINLIGQKFGRLMVIKRVGSDLKNRNPMWLCKCACGKEKIIRGDNLKNGKTKSCGCLNKESPNNKMRLNPGLANMRNSIINYKRHAKQRGLRWNLTEKQFAEITQQDCYYCGAKPNNLSKHKESFGEYIYNGLDRIDNNKGYVIDNIVPCCKDCNRSKYKRTLQEYKDWIKSSYNKMLLV